MDGMLTKHRKCCQLNTDKWLLKLFNQKIHKPQQVI